MSNPTTVSTSIENPELTSEAVASHEEAMIAKAEGAEAKSLEKDSDQFGNETDESLLAGKYKTPEELEKAYKELEAKLGSTKENEETPKENEEETKEAEDVPQTKEEAEAKVEEAGLDFSKLNDEYAQAGELSEDTYKALEAKGIDKQTVDAYIAGQEALAQQEVAKLHQSVGGEEEFTAMIEWAADNLNDTDKAKFNKAVENPDVAEFAIQGLYAKYRADAGPTFVTGNTTSSTSGYQSQREMMRDMASPQYRTDAAYRKAVEQKIARSKF
jgi:hypothetical protein